jgi:hypothetical protein
MRNLRWLLLSLLLPASAQASDTDNTGEEARAGFTDLDFVARDAPCAF